MKKVIYLFVLVATVLQANAQRGLAVHGLYFMPTSNIKPDVGPFLFLKKAKSAGLDYTFGFKNKTSGIKFSADYIMAKTDEEGVAAYAKVNDIPYKTFNFTNPNPAGLRLMAGPNIMLFRKIKRLPLIWLDLQAGAVYSKDQSLVFSQGPAIANKEFKPNEWTIAYAPKVVVNIINSKMILVNANVGYSNFGGLTFGIGISKPDCNGLPCFKCKGKGCIEL